MEIRILLSGKLISQRRSMSDATKSLERAGNHSWTTGFQPVVSSASLHLIFSPVRPNGVPNPSANFEGLQPLSEGIEPLVSACKVVCSSRLAETAQIYCRLYTKRNGWETPLYRIHQKHLPSLSIIPFYGGHPGSTKTHLHMCREI